MFDLVKKGCLRKRNPLKTYGIPSKNKTHPQKNQGWEKNCYEKEN